MRRRSRSVDLLHPVVEGTLIPNQEADFLDSLSRDDDKQEACGVFCE